ncbi:MAG TPA: TniQ family protein, partial [Chloroflexota bacterium]|nr:TniQ family protein [Chloroflexota bacterium]
MSLSEEKDEQDFVLFSPVGFKDEALRSFVRRIAQENRIPPAWILERIGLSPFSNVDLLHGKPLRKLSDFLNLSERDAQDMTVHGFAPALIGAPTFDEGHLRQDVRSTFIRLCPDCVQEAAYVRRHWSLVVITACFKHRRLLIDSCKHGNHRITSRLREISQFQCGEAVGDAGRVPAELLRTDAQRHIQILLGIEPGIATYPETFRALTSPQYFASVRSLQCLVPRKMVRARLSISESHQQLEYAHEVLWSWPNSFYDLLDSYRPHVETFTARFFTPRKMFRQLAEAGVPQFEDAFVTYVRTRWSGRVIQSDRFMRAHAVKPAFVSRNDAASMLKADRRKLAPWIRSGLLETVTQKGGAIRFRRSDVERLAQERTKYLAASAAYGRLGISVVGLDSLVAAGLLTVHSREGELGKRYDLRELEVLEARLAEQMRESPAD